MLALEVLVDEATDVVFVDAEWGQSFVGLPDSFVPRLPCRPSC